MKRQMLMVAAAMVAVALIAAKPKQDDARRDLARLQGTWTMTLHLYNGKPDPTKMGMTRVVQGQSFTIRKGDKVMRAAELKLDPSKDPKWIDITFTAGPEKGKTRRGIYYLDDDTHKVCYGDLDGKRPTKFASKPGSQHRLVVFRRVKQQQVVVHLGHGTNDLHRVFMALKLANCMQARGARVTLFVDLEGVKLADRRQPLALRWGPAKQTVGHYYESFVEGGGKVVVCPHCAEAVGLTSKTLRQGASLATKEQLAEMLLAADKILDY